MLAFRARDLQKGDTFTMDNGVSWWTVASVTLTPGNIIQVCCVPIAKVVTTTFNLDGDAPVVVN